MENENKDFFSIFLLNGRRYFDMGKIEKKTEFELQQKDFIRPWKLYQ